MIKNEYQITWPLFRSWARENACKGRQLLFSIIWAVFAVAVLMINIYSGGVFLYHFLFIFALYCAFLNWIPAAKKQYNALAKLYGSENWTRTITFEDSRIVVQEGETTVKYRYKEILMFREKGNKIWLYASNNSVIRMYRDCFVDSTWEECKDFLREKAGRKKPLEEKA